MEAGPVILMYLLQPTSLCLLSYRMAPSQRVAAVRQQV
jgi:hypothetical protein